MHFKEQTTIGLNMKITWIRKVRGSCSIVTDDGHKILTYLE